MLDNKQRLELPVVALAQTIQGDSRMTQFKYIMHVIHIRKYDKHRFSPERAYS